MLVEEHLQIGIGLDASVAVRPRRQAFGANPKSMSNDRFVVSIDVAENHLTRGLVMDRHDGDRDGAGAEQRVDFRGRAMMRVIEPFLG
ncbi:hypothetical protein J2R81_004140 [Bradyrhizobium sp. USDA 4545]|nr:hypothetical protein [Bradyrhizobium sp. USDA 4545]